VSTFNNHDRPHADLRELVERVRDIGELVEIQGADWNLEIGALTEIVCSSGKRPIPALLFDDIPGYPKGFRILSGLSNSPRRLALTMGLPEPDGLMDLVRAYRDRMKHHRLIPPRPCTAGTVLENVDRDGDVDVFKFPVPWLHQRDGGRYIGTDDLVIMRDPEEGWVNVGCYRVVAHAGDKVGVFIVPGKQGDQIRRKYFERGQACPVLICCGHDPLLFHAAGHEIRFGTSEYDYAGGHRGMPFDVIESELHGLPMPAHAEIVLEGVMLPDESELEGPFGEFTGYYVGERLSQPVVRVQRVYHRNDPILTIATPMRPPSDYSFSRCVIRAGMIWDQIERAGLAGVEGVWCHEAGAGRLFNVIALRQKYPGHAKQAAMLAATCQSAIYFGRFVVVVDDDIDPSNLDEVVWAMSMHCDPAEHIELLRGMWTGPVDIFFSKKPGTNSRAIIDACRPWHMLNDFPPMSKIDKELRARVSRKFADVLKGICGT